MGKNLLYSALLDVYGDFLSEKSKEFMDLYYNEDLSLSEIAENEGITRQGVRDQIKRAEQQLNSLEEKCEYCKKFLRLKELSQQVRNGNDQSLEQMLSIIETI